ncbi:MAG: hypothetical protein DMG61_00230 [Acidobacteria bacterium]|nr:MAG: hypothetical protein DMG60_12325 [Acidobacteriota bacterium]PYY18545.1 MAG: hypothetical protein DMG61_00230 [Acidobacteriota bacterium]
MNNEAAIGIPELASDESWLRQQALKWNRDVKFLIRETRVLSLLLRHPDAPWRAKVVAACTVGYLLSPIQIIPTFIPLIGQLDDLAVLLTGMKLLRRLAPTAALAECEAKADAACSRPSVAT